MPFALLLHHTFHVLQKGAKALEPWNQLVVLEQILTDRARSAFLVHWFGPGLPLYGLSLRIAIDNLKELQLRYQAVVAATTPDASGLNLTEPLAGIGGAAVGMLISPTGFLLLWSVLITRLPAL